MIYEFGNLFHPFFQDEQDDLFELANYVQTNGEYKATSRENSSRALGIKPYSSETEDAFLTTLNQAFLF